MGLGDAEGPPQTHLGPESFTEDEVDEGVQADVEHRHHDSYLLQIEEGAAEPATMVLLENVGNPDQVVGDEADAEDADQHQHVPAGPGQLPGVGGRGLGLLGQRQPAGGAVVEEDEGDEDEEENGGAAAVDDLVQDLELLAVHSVTGHYGRDRLSGFLG